MAQVYPIVKKKEGLVSYLNFFVRMYVGVHRINELVNFSSFGLPTRANVACLKEVSYYSLLIRALMLIIAIR